LERLVKGDVVVVPFPFSNLTRAYIFIGSEPHGYQLKYKTAG